MQRILLGLGTIAVLGGLVAGGSGAFFNDTETSTGNTFTAGDIDLKIDNESYAIDFNIPDYKSPVGRLTFSPGTSWDLADLVAGTHKFFNFVDLKPGDHGEDTISIHVGSNNAWMCAAAKITKDDDNGMTEPEDESALPAGDTLDGTTDGDLDSALNFAFWNDDGDNVYEPTCPEQAEGCVPEQIFLSGPLSGLGAQGQIPLATPTGGAFGTNPVKGNDTVYIGKTWCFGNLTTPGVTQDGFGKTGNWFADPAEPPTNGPLVRPEAVSCDGSAVGNIAQTDLVEGDMKFYAVQARNNPNFSCTSWTPWPVVAPTDNVTS